MTTSLPTFQMVLPPEDTGIVPLLTAGSIKAMVTGDVATLEASSTQRHVLAPKILCSVLTYPCTVMTIAHPDNVYETVSNEFYIYDGEHHVRVQILDNSLDEIYIDFEPTSTSYRHHMKSECFLIDIISFVTSSANVNQEEPILCLTGIEFTEHSLIEAYSSIPSQVRTTNTSTGTHYNLIPPGIPFSTGQGRIMGGQFVDFLTKIAPFMSYETLSGCHNKATSVVSAYNEHRQKVMRLNTTASGNDNVDTSQRERMDTKYDETMAKLDFIARFLSRYQAMKSLATLSSNEDHHALAQLPLTIAMQMEVIESFRRSQLERHKASITANRGRTEPTSTTTAIIEQHHETLQEIYDHKFPLINQSNTDIHIDMLHYCHTKLCRDLIPEVGKFRTTTVRVSTTNFVYHGQMQDVVSRLLSSLQTLRTRLIYLNYDTVTMTNHLSTSTPSNMMTHTGMSPRSTSLLGGTSSGVAAPNPNAVEQRTKDRNTEQQRVLAILTYAAAACMGILDTHPYFDGNGRLARIMLNFILYHHLHLPFPVPLFTTSMQRLEYTRAICKTRQNIALCPIGDVPDNLLMEAYENCGALQPMVHLLLDRIFKSVTECNIQIVDKVSTVTEEIDARTARHVRERALNTDSCPICFESPPNMSTLCCGTPYHLKCLSQWLKTNGKCPHCRFEIPCPEERPTTGNLPRDLRRIANFFSNIIPGDFHEYDDDTLRYGLMSILEENDPVENIDLHDTEELMDENDTEASGDENDTEEPHDENDTIDENDTTEENDDTVVATNVPPECRQCNNLSAFGCTNDLCGRCCRGSGIYCSRHWA